MDAIVSVMQSAAEEAQVERLRPVPVRLGVVEQAFWPEASRRGDFKGCETGTAFPGLRANPLLWRMLPCLLFLALPATGVLGNDRTNDQPAPAVIVHMTAANKFAPDKVTIKAGEAVRWVNDADGPSHTVTTDPSAAQDEDDVEIPTGAKPFSSGIIGPGRFFQQTFERPGTYRYTCVPHEYSRMFGEVVVTK